MGPSGYVWPFMVTPLNTRPSQPLTMKGSPEGQPRRTVWHRELSSQSLTMTSSHTTCPWLLYSGNHKHRRGLCRISPVWWSISPEGNCHKIHSCPLPAEAHLFPGVVRHRSWSWTSSGILSPQERLVEGRQDSSDEPSVFTDCCRRAGTIATRYGNQGQSRHGGDKHFAHNYFHSYRKVFKGIHFFTPLYMVPEFLFPLWIMDTPQPCNKVRAVFLLIEKNGYLYVCFELIYVRAAKNRTVIPWPSIVEYLSFWLLCRCAHAAQCGTASTKGIRRRTWCSIPTAGFSLSVPRTPLRRSRPPGRPGSGLSKRI